MNRIIIAGVAALTLFQANAIAQEGSGFSVGGVGEETEMRGKLV